MGGIGGAAEADVMLGFQAPPLDACPPTCYFPGPLALGHPPVKPWSFTGTLSEPRTLRRTDGRPWAPAPGPEPPALTGWPVAQGERLRRKGVGGKARGMPSESCLLPQSPGIQLNRYFLHPGVCALGNTADPACGGWQPDPEPEGTPPSGP